MSRSKTFEQVVDAIQGVADQRCDSATSRLNAVKLDRKAIEAALILATGGIRRDNYDLTPEQEKRIALRAVHSAQMANNGKAKQRG
ncbi:hypothetical protein IFO70_32820 [Phormidium tenue FACHB-886]|nr:hypothetical protein [Phormidium tenue FACHB-886]